LGTCRVTGVSAGGVADGEERAEGVWGLLQAQFCTTRFTCFDTFSYVSNRSM
jgi:hypothetical protein